jgi:hypothetical protein
VHRILALTGDIVCDPIEIPWGGSQPLEFRPHFSSKSGYLGVADAINVRRRELEMQLGQAMVDAGHPLVILDGRLSLLSTAPPHPLPPGGEGMVRGVLGYAKTMHRAYLPPAEARVLPELAMGQRSPLFVIDERLYSWYLRLAPLRPIDHPLAGLVRLETPTSIPPNRAMALADQTASCLPRFASTPERDPRAPQNLLPIGGLETRLRHEMGDHAWIRRAIESFLHQMAR